MKGKPLNEKAQLSAEMIIILAAIVALALVLITNIKGITQQSVNVAKDKFNDINKQIEGFDKIDDI